VCKVHVRITNDFKAERLQSHVNFHEIFGNVLKVNIVR
jgi:hypothetical protein